MGNEVLLIFFLQNMLLLLNQKPKLSYLAQAYYFNFFSTTNDC